VTVFFAVDHEATYHDRRNTNLRGGSKLLLDTLSDTKGLERSQSFTHMYKKNCTL